MADTENPNASPRGFMDLSQELRQKIYELVLLTSSISAPTDAQAIIKGLDTQVQNNESDGFGTVSQTNASSGPSTVSLPSLADAAVSLGSPSHMGSDSTTDHAAAYHLVKERYLRIYCTPARNPAVPLLLLNKQIHAEVAATLRYLPRLFPLQSHSYDADVLFVKNVGLFVTWLRTPLLSRHLKAVSTSFRVCNPPPGVDASHPLYTSDGIWRHGCGGPALGVWAFHELLEGLLRNDFGPWAPSIHQPPACAEHQQSPSLAQEQMEEEDYDSRAWPLRMQFLEDDCVTVQHLTINCLPAAEPDILPLCGQKQNFKGDGLFFGEELSHEDMYLPAQKRAAIHLSLTLEGGLYYLMQQPGKDYINKSNRLFTQVGEVDVLADGTRTAAYGYHYALDLPEAFAKLTFCNGVPEHERDTHYRATRAWIFKWKRETEARRARAGFRMVYPATQEHDT